MYKIHDFRKILVTQEPQPGNLHLGLAIPEESQRGEKCHLLLIRQGRFSGGWSKLQE